MTHTHFPISQKGRARSFSTEKVLIDGMEVQFDERVGTMAVDLVEKSTPASQTNPTLARTKTLSIREAFAKRRLETDPVKRGMWLQMINRLPKDPYESWLGKRFKIKATENNAIIRDEKGNSLKYKKGDSIPLGKKEGQSKTIPAGQTIYVTDISQNLKRVYAEDWGWTSISNIEGELFNETLGMRKAKIASDKTLHRTVGAPKCFTRKPEFAKTYPKVSPSKTIPQGTKVSIIQNTKADRGNSEVKLADGKTYWTRTSNLSTKPGSDGKYTVTDRQAIIRKEKKSDEYISTGTTLKQGEWVIIREASKDTQPEGKFVKVAFVKQNSRGEYLRDAEKAEVWVAHKDLSPGWADYKGPHATWRKPDDSHDRKNGFYKGQIHLVDIVGVASGSGKQDRDRISTSLLPKYLALVNAAKKDGHEMRLISGFRSYPEQEVLWHQLGHDTSKVARPGRSNHQNGIAIDINTEDFYTPLYNWLMKNAPKYHFIRTVNKEDWHWEYRPEDAKAHGYKMPDITKG